MRSFIRTVLLCAAICCYHIVEAQYQFAPQPPSLPIISQPAVSLGQVINEMRAHIDPADTVEGDEKDELNAFQTFWQGRVVGNGTSGPNMFQQYYHAMRTTMLAGRGACAGGWQCIGPMELPHQMVGKTDAVWADPADSNRILAGSIAGGLFKTIDGGQHWACITDNIPLAGGAMGVSNIAVNPLDKQHIYLGTVGAGILESSDGGNTWRQEFIQRGGSPAYTDSIENTMVYISEDTSYIYAISDKWIYTRSLTGSAWTEITPTKGTAVDDSVLSWNNFAFVPGHPDHFFVSGRYKHPYYGVLDTFTKPQYSMPAAFIWEATSAVPSSWTKISTAMADTFVYLYLMAGIYDTVIAHDTDVSLFNIAVSNANTVYIICNPILDYPVSGIFSGYNSGRVYKYRFTPGSTKWELCSRNLPSANDQKFVLAVPSSDTNTMYYGEVGVHVSFDEGKNFVEIGIEQPDANPTHNDFRCIYIQKAGIADSGINDRVYFANDGGVSKKPAGVNMREQQTLATKNINGYGLACGTFNGFTTSEASGAGLGGMMHDGVMSYDPHKAQPWKSLFGSDAWRSTTYKNHPDTGLVWWGSNTLDETGNSMTRRIDTVAYQYGTAETPGDAGFPEVGAPIGTDNQGNAYYVQHKFYMKIPGTTTFNEPSGTPLGFGFPRLPNLFGAQMALDPTAFSFTGYVLYNDTGSNPPQIFYRIPPADANKIASPPADSTFPVVDITTDQRNTGHVWVCQGGVDYRSSPSAPRVQYSPDHGTTWYNISNGLPLRIPVTHIIYDESMDVLYCSTDAGIYKCDFSTFNISSPYTSVTWSCFSQGAPGSVDFPNTPVTSLVINHCQGILYAATNGRSVWATNIHADQTILQPSDIIHTTTTWSGGHHHYIEGGIDIPAGVTLTISGDTVHMPQDGLIIVEPGGKLVIDHSLLTNSCTHCMWQGIQVRGNTGSPQTPTDQGWLVVKGGTIIEHAKIAVANCNTDTALFFGTTGGIIQASNSTFLNNVSNATFRTYDNYDIHGYKDDLSAFHDCAFILDNNYRGNWLNLPMKNLTYLSGVTGITFTGCVFHNFYNVDGLNKRNGEGIHSHNSSFRVVSDGGYPVGEVRSVFTGFKHGIYVENVAGFDFPVLIDRAIFDTVTVGVDVSVAEDVHTTRCNFTVGNGIGMIDVVADTFSGCAQNIGINIQNAATYVVEGNVFIGKPNHTLTSGFYSDFGVVVANTGEFTNKIYKNSFGDSLTYGIYSIGANRANTHPTYSGGLMISCNVFMNNYEDVRIAPDKGTAYQGINFTQDDGKRTDAGNTFHCSTYNLVNRTTIPVNYYKEGPYLLCPNTTKWPLNNVTTASILIGIPPGLPNTCLSSFGDVYPPGIMISHGLDITTLSAYKADFYTTSSSYGSALSVYNSHIDYGNTATLLSNITAASNGTVLYSLLSGGAPWLSGAAVQAAANRSMLSNAQMFDIMARNPDNIWDSALVASVSTAYSFSVLQSDSIAACAQITTERTTTEQSLDTMQDRMDRDANIIIVALKSPVDTLVSVFDSTGAGRCTDTNSVYYRVDSNAHYLWLDSVDTWLQLRGRLWSNYERAEFYHRMHHNEIADTIVTHISHILPSALTDPTDWAVYNSYSTLWNVIKTAEADGRDEYRLTPTEISSLGTLSDPETTYNTGDVMTAGIITAFTSKFWIPVKPEPCMIPEVVSSHPSSRHSNPSAAGNSSLAPQTFRAYPNPSGSIITFDYNVPTAKRITITISNVLGEKVVQLQAVGGAGHTQWDPAKVAPGVYIYEATGDNGNIATGKLIINGK